MTRLAGSADEQVFASLGALDAAAVQTVGTTSTQMAYVKAILDILAGGTGISTFPNGAAAANGVSLAEVLRYIEDILVGTAGVVTFPSAAAPANGVSLAEVLREMYDQQEKSINNTAATLVNGTTIFTVAGGPIEIVALHARCVTANDATASTLQWSTDPTDGAATTISGASASLESAAAGASVNLVGTALSTAPTVTANGAALAATRRIYIPPGIITTTVGVGSTTGTWMHHMRYIPCSRGVTVS